MWNLKRTNTGAENRGAVTREFVELGDGEMSVRGDRDTVCGTSKSRELAYNMMILVTNAVLSTGSLCREYMSDALITKQS